MITREKALEILNANIKNKNLLKHCLAVEAAMKTLAKHFNADENKWRLLGLMHDGDWEVTQINPVTHTAKMIEWLKQAGETDEEILYAMSTHNFVHTGQNEPQNMMEWSLYCSDELTGLIIAATLVLPDKKLASLSAKSVLKRFKEKKFAAGARREQIAACEEKLNIKLEDFVQMILVAMQQIAPELGL